MLRPILTFLGLVVAIAAGLSWWLLISGSTAPKIAPAFFSVEGWRALVDELPVATRPTGLRMVEIGSDVAPGFAAQAGAFGGDYVVSYTSFVIDTPDGQIIVGGAVDQMTAEAITQSPEDATFHADRYNKLVDAMVEARAVVMTHEHIDHVMAIARHPNPAAIADTLLLNVAQKEALASFREDGILPQSIASVPPALTGGDQMIAPGVMIVPNPGHTPGSQSVYVSLQDGREYLLIGDIVWTMSNVTDLKTRPLITQYMVFDPNEDRKAVKQQVRALHDLRASAPELVIVPSHDRVYLRGLVNEGKLSE